MMQIYHVSELLWKAPTVFTEWTVIHWSNCGPDLGVGRGGRLGVEIGAALSRKKFSGEVVGGGAGALPLQRVWLPARWSAERSLRPIMGTAPIIQGRITRARRLRITANRHHPHLVLQARPNMILTSKTRSSGFQSWPLCRRPTTTASGMRMCRISATDRDG